MRLRFVVRALVEGCRWRRAQGLDVFVHFLCYSCVCGVGGPAGMQACLFQVFLGGMVEFGVSAVVLHLRLTISQRVSFAQFCVWGVVFS